MLKSSTVGAYKAQYTPPTPTRRNSTVASRRRCVLGITLQAVLLVVEKIFADSSFYDEPQHKYPTIEEQIKMARRVAQSLTSPGNVKARGQRMFLRRKEKADHWAIDAFGPRPGLRRVAAARAAAAVAEASESESELPYYNPAPWATAPVGRSPWGGGGGSVTVNAWVPTASPAPWQPVRHVDAVPMPTHTGNVPPQVIDVKNINLQIKT